MFLFPYWYFTLCSLFIDPVSSTLITCYYLLVVYIANYLLPTSDMLQTHSEVSYLHVVVLAYAIYQCSGAESIQSH